MRAAYNDVRGEQNLRLKTFSGGVHPPAAKGLTKGAAIVEASLPGSAIIPLRQSLGAPARPCVEVGDEVQVGQKIAEATGFVSVPLHASIAGKITEIGRFPHPVGGEQDAIVIEGDGSDEWHESVTPREDVESLSADEIRDAVQDAGLVGLGGAAFPTRVKLSPPESKPIDSVILNGAECEPWLTADHRLMVERPEEILGGLRVFMKALGCERGFVGIEANKPDAVEAMRKAIPKGSKIKVVALQVKYPQGAEKQLIHAILKRAVPAGGLPMDVGVVVQNVGTSLAAYEAVHLGRPLVRRVVTVTGTPLASPSNFMARIGTPVSALVEQAGGTTGDVSKVISGGPMMGVAQFTLDVPVIKGMSGVLFLSPGETDVGTPDPCLRCAHCVHSCPMKLVPTTIEKLVMAEKIDEAVSAGLLDCIECGSCAYVCPSRRRLVQYFKYGKYVANERRKAEAARAEGKEAA